MGDIGIPELLIILAILVILFGPSRLAGLGKSLGQGIREFKMGVRDVDVPNSNTASQSEITTIEPRTAPEELASGHTLS